MPSVPLHFWHKGTVAGYIAQPGTITTYTRVLPTRQFTEVVAQLNFDAPILDPTGIPQIAFIQVTPQNSSNGKDWEDQTPFASVLQGSSYPTKEVMKLTEISEFMRFKIDLTDPVDTGYLGGTFALHAVGRWEDE